MDIFRTLVISGCLIVCAVGCGSSQVRQPNPTAYPNGPTPDTEAISEYMNNTVGPLCQGDQPAVMNQPGQGCSQ